MSLSLQKSPIFSAEESCTRFLCDSWANVGIIQHVLQACQSLIYSFICVTLSPAQSEWAPRRMHLCWVMWHHSTRPRLLSGKRQMCWCQFGKLNILVEDYKFVKRDLYFRPQRPIFSAKVPYISGKRALYSRQKRYILFGKIHVLEKTIRCARHDYDVCSERAGLARAAAAVQKYRVCRQRGLFWWSYRSLLVVEYFSLSNRVNRSLLVVVLTCGVYGHTHTHTYTYTHTHICTYTQRHTYIRAHTQTHSHWLWTGIARAARRGRRRGLFW